MTFWGSLRVLNLKIGFCRLTSYASSDTHVQASMINDWILKQKPIWVLLVLSNWKINSCSHCRCLSVCVYLSRIMFVYSWSKNQKSHFKDLSCICSALLLRTMLFCTWNSRTKSSIFYSKTSYIYHFVPCGCHRLKTEQQ